MNNDLLLKYVKGETTEAEDAQVYKWIEETPQNRRDFDQLQRVYQAILCQEIPDLHTESRSHRKTISWIAAAAILLLAVPALLLMLLRQSSSEPANQVAIREINVPAGQRSHIILDDGTSVWVNSNSTLICSADMDDKQRHVTIKGEAYLDVAPDKEHPFIVSTGNRDIKVLGTKFDVKTDSQGKKLYLKLYSGNIEIHDGYTRQSHKVCAGHQIEFNKEQVILSELTDNSNSPLWIDGIYRFDNATFGEIFQDIARNYDFTLKINDPAVLSCKATCKFRMEDGFQHIINSLQQIHDFSASWDDNDRILTIE